MKIKWLCIICGFIWLLCVCGVIAVVFIATNGFKGTVQATSFGKSDLFIKLFIGLLLFGVLSFGIGAISTILFFLFKNENKNTIQRKKTVKGKMWLVLKSFLILAIFPLFLLYKTVGLEGLIKKIRQEGFKSSFFKPKGIKFIIARLAIVIIISLILVPLWIGGYAIVDLVIKNQLGYWPKPIPISGTGSMYPTFPKGQGKTPQEQAKEIVGTPGMLPYPNGLLINGKRFFNHEITRDDIVVIDNNKIREITQKMYGIPSGLMKRVIAIGGDTIELKSGIVYLNDKPLKEPYTAKARSTFGESFLQECKKLTIPANSIFVMGDNRKGSGDSREDGPFELKAVKFVLSLEKQKGLLDKNWRNTSSDFNESSKIKLDKTKYLELLNEKRKEAGVKSLKYQPLLEKSAFKRGEIILKYNDFSYEATRSGYTQLKAMNDVGYSNIVYGEGPNQGYYEANELIDNQFEFPKTKDFLLEKDYQEIGIAEVEGSLNGCPAQVIVQHFAGYIPPNYKKEDIESWEKTVDNLNSIIPSWEKSIGWKNINQDDLKRLLDLFYRERTIATNILTKIQANQWLTQAEQDSIKEYDSLTQQSISLANKLNEK